LKSLIFLLIVDEQPPTKPPAWPLGTVALSSDELGTRIGERSEMDLLGILFVSFVVVSLLVRVLPGHMPVS
jgi:hypothetical protein